MRCGGIKGFVALSPLNSRAFLRGVGADDAVTARNRQRTARARAPASYGVHWDRAMCGTEIGYAATARVSCYQAACDPSPRLSTGSRSLRGQKGAEEEEEEERGGMEDS
eukprot:2907221-Rhodomonas_salina.1